MSVKSVYLEFIYWGLGVSRELFSPISPAYEHQYLRVIKTVRTIGGLIIVGLVVIPYGGVYSTVVSAMQGVIFNLWAGLMATVFCLAAYAWINRRYGRQAYPARRTVRTIMGGIGCLLLLLLIGSLSGIIGVVLVVVFLLPAFFRCAYLVVANWFNVADTHQLLPAFCTAMYFALLFLYNTILILMSPVGPDMPIPITVIMSVGGPGLVSVLALAEMTLAYQVGITLRLPPPPFNQFSQSFPPHR